MKRTALALAAALAAASTAPPVLAQGVDRPEDGSPSCEALAAEIGKLEAAEQKRAQRAESGRKLMGFAGAAFNAAAPTLLARSGAYEEAAIARSLAGSIQANGAGAAPAAVAPSPQAARLERAKALVAERGCPSQ